MLDKDLFNKEIDNLLQQANEKENLEIREKLDKAYKLSCDLQMSSNKVNISEAHQLVSDILQYFFKNKYSTTYSIPAEFIESEIGKVLFTLKFGVGENVYTPAAISAIMGITRALVSHDLKNEAIQATKRGKNIIVYEKDLIKYMESKKMSKEEIDYRIGEYIRLNEQGMSEKEIKEILNPGKDKK